MTIQINIKSNKHNRIFKWGGINMLGYKHFKFEQYKLWCKNHKKKACKYVNFKTFIELYGGVN